MAARNGDIPADRRVLYRIGINVGEVIDQDGDLLGDGVNIAARPEGLAPLGGVVQSATVHDQIRDRLALPLADMGAVEVKNIVRPVRSVRWAPPGAAPAGPRGRAMRNWPVLVGLAAVLAAAAAFW